MVWVCSLINDEKQSIPGDGKYHLLKFPFGAAESYDVDGMHNILQPDGYRIDSRRWREDQRSGLIWPIANGWGALTGTIYWEPGSYNVLWDVFTRDPLGDAPDDTCREKRALTGDKEYLQKHHEIFVSPYTPIGIMVAHDSARAVNVWHAQFKLAIHE